MNVSPGRFSDKTEREEKLASINWTNAIGSQAISEQQWWSEPTGLVFTDQSEAAGVTSVRISAGSRGQTYRVRHMVTLSGTGEKLELTHNGEPGVVLQITGHGRAGDDYRWSHRFAAYG